MKQEKTNIGNVDKKKLLRSGGYATLISLFAIAAVVVINLIVNAFPSTYTKFDTSSNDIYTLSEDTVGLLSGLNTDVTLYYIVQENNKDIYVSGTLERYAALSSRITVKQIDPALHPNFASQYTDESVNENSVIAVSEKRSKAVLYDDMYEVEYGIDYSTYQYTQNVTGFRGENAISTAIDFVSTDVLPKVYFLSGHRETEMDETFLGYLDEANIAHEFLSLIGKESVPEDCECIIINAPQSDITDDEKDLILAWTASGGHLMVITSYDVSVPNLEEILAYYGAERAGGLVCDPGAGRYYRTPYYLIPLVSSAHEIISPLSENRYTFFVPVADGIRQTSEVRDTVTYTALLYTSTDAYAKVALNETLEKESGDISGPFNLAVAIEEETDEGTAKIVWISSDQMMTTDADFTCSGANSALFVNAAGWMCEKASAISVHTKSLATETLTVSSTSANIWGAVLIFVIPACVIGVGIYIWVKRRKR